MQPEWLKPGCRGTQGVGHDGSYGDLSEVQDTVRKLIASMLHKSTLPVQSVINLARSIPKKVISGLQGDNIMATYRPIHMFNHFTQSMVRAIERKPQGRQ